MAILVLEGELGSLKASIEGEEPHPAFGLLSAS